MNPIAFPEPRPPRSVTVARWTGITQMVATLICAVVIIGVTVAAYVSDRAAVRHGNPNDWSGLVEFIGVVSGTLTVFAALVVGIPVLMLRRGRPGPRIVLIVGEALTLFWVGGALLFGLSWDLYSLLALADTALAVGTLVAITRPSAQAWTSDVMALPQPYGVPAR